MRKIKLLLLGTGISLLAGYRLWALAFSHSVLPASAIFLLSQMPNPVADDRVLVFSPHPDDETIGMGGFIFNARRAGATVRIVLASDGDKHGLRDRRYEEFRRATERLGVNPTDLRFWGYPDGSLKTHEENLKREAAEEIGSFQPTIVLYPHPDDHHSDHAVLGRVTEELLVHTGQGERGIRGFRYLVHHRDFPQPKTLAREAKLMPPLSMLGLDQRWHVFELSPETQEAKNNALREYRTQLRNPFLYPLLVNLLRENELFSEPVDFTW